MARFLITSSPASEDRDGILRITITQEAARPRTVEAITVDGLAQQVRTYADDVRAGGYMGGFHVSAVLREGRKPAGFDKRWKADLTRYVEPAALAAAAE